MRNGKRSARKLMMNDTNVAIMTREGVAFLLIKKKKIATRKIDARAMLATQRTLLLASTLSYHIY